MVIFSIILLFLLFVWRLLRLFLRQSSLLKLYLVLNLDLHLTKLYLLRTIRYTSCRWDGLERDKILKVVVLQIILIDQVTSKWSQ